MEGDRGLLDRGGLEGHAPRGPGHVHLYTYCFLAQKGPSLLGPGSDREKE